MNSQEDLFATQEPFETQKSKKIIYDFLILCNKDEGVTHPFALYPRSMFTSGEIIDRWLDSILDHSSRLKTLHTLEGVYESSLALFGKIDEGK